jgi:hypothetical protein
MARTPARLPKRLPPGSIYVVEARGRVQGMILMHRYVQLPDGRRIELVARFVRPCGSPAKAAQNRSERPARSLRRQEKARAPALVD